MTSRQQHLVQRLLKVSASLVIAELWRFFYRVKKFHISIIQSVTEITKYIDFKMPSQI